jgi:hypothetical protein
MAGEKTKSIGEYGEKIGRSLLDLLGWKDTIRNISITCNLGDEHKNDKGTQNNLMGMMSYLYTIVLFFRPKISCTRFHKT